VRYLLQSKSSRPVLVLPMPGLLEVRGKIRVWPRRVITKMWDRNGSLKLIVLRYR
jgi:hypothetical protein